jgi:hypothetical protein
MHDFAIGALMALDFRGAKDFFVKIDRADGILDDEVWRKGMVPLGNRLHICHLCPPDYFGGPDFHPRGWATARRNCSKRSFQLGCADVKEYTAQVQKKNCYGSVTGTRLRR